MADTDKGLPLSSQEPRYALLETVGHQPSPSPSPPPTSPPSPLPPPPTTREVKHLAKVYPLSPKSPPPSPPPTPVSKTSETKRPYQFPGPIANFFPGPGLTKIVLASVGTGTAAFLIVNGITKLMPQQSLWIIGVLLLVGSLALVVAFLSREKFPKFVIGSILVVAAIVVIGSVILPPGLVFIAFLCLFFVVILPTAVFYLFGNQGRFVGVLKKPAGYMQAKFPSAEAVKLLFDDDRHDQEKTIHGGRNKLH